MPVSFSKNVKPMFREVDIKQMKIHGVLLGPVNTTKISAEQGKNRPVLSRDTPHRDPLRHVVNRKCASSSKAGLQICVRASAAATLRAFLRTKRPRAAQKSLPVCRWSTFCAKTT